MRATVGQLQPGLAQQLLLFWSVSDKPLAIPRFAASTAYDPRRTVVVKD